MLSAEHRAWLELERKAYSEIKYWLNVQSQACTLIQSTEEHRRKIGYEACRRAEIKTEYLLRRLDEIKGELKCLSTRRLP